MRILIFNWKDIKHPSGGGAEIVTHQFAKHLVASGHQVTIFTSSYPDALPLEIIEGVRIIRSGSLRTVHIRAAYAYMTRLRKEVDLVIDQIHGLPFFTPLYVQKPILTYIHEVAGIIWLKEFLPIIGIFGLCIEQLYFYLYRNIAFLTHSNSTKSELIQKGIPPSHIHLITPTIEHRQFTTSQKTAFPSLVYVGRISAMKRTEWLIEIAALLIKYFPQLRIYIIGCGKEAAQARLRQLRKKYGLDEVVLLLGRLTEAQKYQYLRQSWLHVHPSIKEGFGLTVLEAASVGTPTVICNVSGLRDIVNKKNGVLAKHNSPTGLAQTVMELLLNHQRRNELSLTASAWAKKLPTWETQTKKLENLLNKITMSFLN